MLEIPFCCKSEICLCINVFPFMFTNDLGNLSDNFDNLDPLPAAKINPNMIHYFGTIAGLMAFLESRVLNAFSKPFTEKLNIGPTNFLNGYLFLVFLTNSIAM